MKRPSFQFYPGDWLNDAALRTCSVGARGLWIEMLCLMHQGSDYGYLKVNHIPILPVNLARISGATLPEVEGYLSELTLAGVFSVDDGGCIYSRRMIRDETIRGKRASGGILGGNPALKKVADKDNNKVASKVNLVANLRPTPSSSSSSSSLNTPKPPPDGFEAFWEKYPKKTAKPAALKAFKAQKVNGELPAILADITRKAASSDWQKEGGQFIPNPATYLNQRRWEDLTADAAPEQRSWV
jgi:hypothetical protein